MSDLRQVPPPRDSLFGESTWTCTRREPLPAQAHSRTSVAAARDPRTRLAATRQECAVLETLARHDELGGMSDGEIYAEAMADELLSFGTPTASCRRARIVLTHPHGNRVVSAGFANRGVSGRKVELWKLAK